MTRETSLERRIADYYAAEQVHRAPDRVLQSALITIRSTSQRRVLMPAPWRRNDVNTYMRLAIAAAIVIAAVVVGVGFLFGPLQGVGTRPVATPSPTPSPTPTPTPAYSAIPLLTGEFSSDVHGAAVAYPSGWQTRAATEPWPDGAGIPTFESAYLDTMFDNSQPDLKFIGLASETVAPGQTAADWMSAIADDPDWTPECRRDEPILIDGVTGEMHDFCNVTIALAVEANRGYLVIVYGVDDRASFDAVIRNVRLNPEAAGLPSPSPTPSPSSTP